jgi:putative drug exporter of the RND superfamily
MAVMGRWNWWLPNWMAKALRVAPSSVEPARRREPVTEAG